MSAPWRIVDCSTMSGALHSVRGGITIEPQGEPPVRLPLADVAVLLVGPGVALGPSVMQRLARHDVTLLPLDWRAIPVGALAPWVDHGRVGARHLAQSRMSLPRRKNAWARLVRSKILGQAEVLRVLGRRRSGDLREIARSVRSGDPHNAEAQAARAYWASLFPRTSSEIPELAVISGTRPWTTVTPFYGVMGSEQSLPPGCHQRSGSSIVGAQLLQPRR